MKKKMIMSAIAVVILTLSSSSAFAACPLTDKYASPSGAKFGHSSPPCWAKAKDVEKMKKIHEKRKAEMDYRLKLTEEQKKLAEQNRLEGRKQLKPIIDEIRAKKAKKVEIFNSTSISKEDKEKQIYALRCEIKELKAKANKLREENMKAFEAILTDKQKKELEKIKQEHRARMGKTFKKHKCCPPPEEE